MRELVGGTMVPPGPDPVCVPADADVAWMLMATVLVLGMFPGVAFFEAGLLRGKNTTSILAQVFCGLTVLSVMWVAFGYSLTFGPSQGGFIGNFDYIFLVGIGFEDCYPGTAIPTALQAMFQLMFACITPLLMTGAFAERLAWKPFIIFTILWEILVYYPVAHWLWNTEGWLSKRGALDFAGGIVIHETAGVSALIAVYFLGQRRGFDKYDGEFPYSSLPFAAVGTTLLWTGWFGFNGGSGLAANHIAIHAVVNSQIGASVSAVTFLAITTYKTKRPSTIAIMNGAIAGLAGITPASGYISTVAAFVLGFLLGICSYAGIFFLKHKMRIDDALDVSSVHGIPGIVGALYIGIAAQTTINSSGFDGLYATRMRDWTLMGNQCIALLACGAWSVVFTFGILTTIKRFMPLRVTHHQEYAGLDAALHDEGVVHMEHGGSVNGSLSTPPGETLSFAAANVSFMPPNVSRLSSRPGSQRGNRTSASPHLRESQVCYETGSPVSSEDGLDIDGWRQEEAPRLMVLDPNQTLRSRVGSVRGGVQPYLVVAPATNIFNPPPAAALDDPLNETTGALARQTSQIGQQPPSEHVSPHPPPEISVHAPPSHPASDPTPSEPNLSVQ